MASTITGNKAVLSFDTNLGTLHAISDFSLTFDRGTVEQELLGETGNFFTQGALSIDGSLTMCRFGASGSAAFLDGMIDGDTIAISGHTNKDSVPGLGWYFTTVQVTGYDISIGDASTISEASIDFSIMNPYDVTYSKTTGWIEG